MRLTLAVVAVLLFAAVPTSAAPRDVVVIMTDDQPWHSVAHMPHLQALIGDQGIRFSRAYVSDPLCCPSRASFLTGKYARNHGVIYNNLPLGGFQAFDDTDTIAVRLQAAGYRTGLVGKYLNEYPVGADVTQYTPPGWDDWRAFSFAYWQFWLSENGTPVLYANPAWPERRSDLYSTNVLRDKAVAFIDGTPAAQPLFLFFSVAAPHKAATFPAEVDPVDAGLPFPVWRPGSFNEADISDKPPWMRKLPLANEAEVDHEYLQHVRALQAVDRAIRDLVDALSRRGTLDDALIIFTSDHGFAYGEHRWRTKLCPHEACTKVPLLIRAPGVTPGTRDQLVSNVDLAPTIAAWAGIDPPTGGDGLNLLPLLADASTPWRTALLMETLATRNSLGNVDVWRGVVTASHLYVEYARGERELYDLVTDPDELVNRAADPSMAATREALRTTLRLFDQQADLGVSVKYGGAALVGGQIEYVVTARNAGPDPAGAVRVMYMQPSPVTEASCVSVERGSCLRIEGAERWLQIPLLEPGATQTFRVVSQLRPTVGVGSTVMATYTIGSDNVADPTDPLRLKNAVVATTKVVTPADFLQGFTRRSDYVTPCAPTTGAVSLAYAAPPGGLTVSLAASSGAASMPASVVLPSGQATGPLTIQATPGSAITRQTVTLSATLGSKILSRSIAVNPAGWFETTGTTTQATVTLDCAVASPTVVEMSTSNPAIARPAAPTITIPAGQRVGAVGLVRYGAGTVTVTGKANGIRRSATITMP